MKNKPAPLLNPGTLKPMTARELDGVFCDELVQQELDDTTACILSQLYRDGKMTDCIPTDADLQKGFDGIPHFPGNE